MSQAFVKSTKLHISVILYKSYYLIPGDPKMYAILTSLTRKNTIRDGINCLNAVDTVDHLDMVYTVGAVDTVYTVDTAFTIYTTRSYAALGRRTGPGYSWGGTFWGLSTSHFLPPALSSDWT